MSGPIDSPQPVHDELVRLLEADAALMAIVTGIYKGKADEGAAYPYVVFNLQDGPDRLCFGGGGDTDLAYLVKVVDEGFSSRRAWQAAARFRPALEDDSRWNLAAAGLRVTAVTREMVLDEPETDGATTLQNVGGIFKVWAEKQ